MQHRKYFPNPPEEGIISFNERINCFFETIYRRDFYSSDKIEAHSFISDVLSEIENEADVINKKKYKMSIAMLEVWQCIPEIGVFFTNSHKQFLFISSLGAIEIHGMFNAFPGRDYSPFKQNEQQSLILSIPSKGGKNVWGEVLTHSVEYYSDYNKTTTTNYRRL